MYETINNFAASPRTPDRFRIFRKDLKRPSSDAWVVAPSNGFNRIGESSHRSYGSGLGHECSAKASVDGGNLRGRDFSICSATTTKRRSTRRMGGSEVELAQLEQILKLSVDEFKAKAGPYRVRMNYRFILRTS